MRMMNFAKLEEILKFEYPLFAHKHQKKEKETLKAHTNLCQEYYIKLYHNKNSAQFFDKILESFNLSETELCKELFFEMLDNIITFHDTGKSNPEYQRIVMEEKIDEKYRVDWLDGRKHSLFSSFIYINYYMLKIENTDIGTPLKRILRGFCLINGMVISRHHTDLSEMQEFINGYCQNGASDWIRAGVDQSGLFVKTSLNSKTEKYPVWWRNFRKHLDHSQTIGIYIYSRFIYSILVACDYYATTEYMNDVKTTDFGDLEQGTQLKDAYEKNKLIQGIRKGKKAEGINVLRTEIFLETERVMRLNNSADLFFLEAPTGSGKSNTAMNLSFQLIGLGARKIYYVYPFNTLVEQNLITLKETFGEDSEEFHKIVVINSNTPIKQSKKDLDDADEVLDEGYVKALLDRQFLNYSFVLTTHVTLFEIFFSNKREAVFGFQQLQNSVIVLDEIQSYKNTIWTEMIMFFKEFAHYLNMKVIIMSATLPDLSHLTDKVDSVVYLMSEPDKYFKNKLFQERVQISYELLDQQMDLEILKDHVLNHSTSNDKVVVEFIKKKRAYEFVSLLKETDLEVPLYLISGDDNRADRQKKIKYVKESRKGLILIATQVIEAGVDIDMDIGYKDTSKLDSEEQFLGRINRSCKRSGMVYFFNLDDAKKVYSDGDFRVSHDLTLENVEMRAILKEKKFSEYYHRVMDYLRDRKNNSLNTDDNLNEFFDNQVKGLDFIKISERMKLIEDSDWEMSIFLSRTIHIDDKELAGDEVWNQYKELLNNNNLEYSEKQVKLSEVKSKLNNFIYQIKKSNNISYNDQIGELYKIDDGADFFDEDGIFQREKLEAGTMIF